MSERILIVDDEALIRKSLNQVLSRRGYEVSVAATAEEARAAFSPGEFALVLLDLRLPDGNGVDLLREFREAQGDLLAIMMTAYGSVESAVEAMRLGAYDYVNKPFKSREIEVIVRLALETGNLKREVRELRVVENGQRHPGNDIDGMHFHHDPIRFPHRRTRARRTRGSR